jgi:hypothetical protein
VRSRTQAGLSGREVPLASPGRGAGRQLRWLGGSGVPILAVGARDASTRSSTRTVRQAPSSLPSLVWLAQAWPHGPASDRRPNGRRSNGRRSNGRRASLRSKCMVRERFSMRVCAPRTRIRLLPGSPKPSSASGRSEYCRSCQQAQRPLSTGERHKMVRHCVSVRFSFARPWPRRECSGHRVRLA